jgi:hypothetical protein
MEHACSVTFRVTPQPLVQLLIARLAPQLTAQTLPQIFTLILRRIFESRATVRRIRRIVGTRIRTPLALPFDARSVIAPQIHHQTAILHDAQAFSVATDGEHAVLKRVYYRVPALLLLRKHTYSPLSFHLPSLNQPPDGKLERLIRPN